MPEESEAPWELLAHGVGEWEGREWFAGLEAQARLTARSAFDGRGLVSDHVQEVDGRVSATHTVVRWDPARAGFVLHFFPASGPPSVLDGVRVGDTIVFEGDAEHGRMRQTMDYGGEDMAVTSEVPGPEGVWSTVFEGHYRKAEEAPAATGTVAWRDLTVDDADGVRDFYGAVVGWGHEALSMGDYADYVMTDSAGDGVAGVCHRKGENADVPPVWLVYVTVPDLDRALAEVARRGGGVVVPARPAGGGRMAVIQDPAGALLALFES